MHRVFLGLVLLLGFAEPARAIKYRLQVANLYRDSFAHYFDGPIGAGSGELVMERLGRALDTDGIPNGALLPDRAFRYGWEAVAMSFRSVEMIAEIKRAEGSRRWDEVVWEGSPGERSVWVIAPTTIHTQEVIHVALQGVPLGSGETSALRYYLPYRVTGSPTPQAAVTYPLDFLRFYENRGPALWDHYLSRSTALSARGSRPWSGRTRTPPSPTGYTLSSSMRRGRSPSRPWWAGSVAGAPTDRTSQESG